MMHKKDREKILAAGFVLYRCSVNELLIKKQTASGNGWKIESRAKTKAEVERVSLQLLNDPKAIQD